MPRSGRSGPRWSVADRQKLRRGSARGCRIDALGDITRSALMSLTVKCDGGAAGSVRTRASPRGGPSTNWRTIMIDFVSRRTERFPASAPAPLRALMSLVALPVVLGVSACTPAGVASQLTGPPASARPASTSPAASAAARPQVTMAVRASGWGQANGTTWVTAQLRNTGSTAGAASVDFIAYGSGNRVLGYGRSAAVQLVSGQTTAVGALLDVAAGEHVQRLTTTLDTALLPAARPGAPTIAGVNLRPATEDAPARLLATINTSVATPVMVTALCYDAAGRISGGGATTLAALPAGGLTPFALTPLVVPNTPARCSVYTAIPVAPAPAA